jgi:hypothetical protein
MVNPVTRSSPKFYPATILYALNTAVAFLVAFGLNLSATQTAAITTIATAVLGIAVAFTVRPPAVPVISAAFASALAAGASFGLHLSPNQIGVTIAALSLVVGFLTHQNVTPKAGSPTGNPLGVSGV